MPGAKRSARRQDLPSRNRGRRAGSDFASRAEPARRSRTHTRTRHASESSQRGVKRHTRSRRVNADDSHEHVAGACLQAGFALLGPRPSARPPRRALAGRASLRVAQDAKNRRGVSASLCGATRHSNQVTWRQGRGSQGRCVKICNNAGSGVLSPPPRFHDEGVHVRTTLKVDTTAPAVSTLEA